MSKQFRTGVSIFLTVLCTIITAQAQEITDTHWYLGNSPDGFIFDKSGRSARLVDDQHTPFGVNGSAVISDQDKGNLLFYSDGQYIYDTKHEILPGIGPSQLSGDLGLIQPVVASPSPGNDGQYYFFTNTGSNIEFTLVDATLPGNSTIAEFPHGDILGNLNTPTNITNAAELMKVIRTTNGQRFWLITQEATSLDLQVTEITSAGLGTTNTYDIFPDSIPAYEITSIAQRRDSVSLAIAPKNANRNIILLTFDEVTGAVGFSEQLLGTGFNDNSEKVVYDAEWSNDGYKLYVSRTGSDSIPGQVYQIDLLDSVNSPRPLVPIMSTNFYRSYGLSKAINGDIYHLHQLTNGAPFTVGRIYSPDSTASDGVNYDSLEYEIDFQATQFPEFAPAYHPSDYFDMNFTYVDFCEGNSTKFAAIIDPLPNNIFWDFGDGTGGTGPAPIHEYPTQAPYFVTLIAELNGVIQTTMLPVDILPSDTVDLGEDTTICVDEIMYLKNRNENPAIRLQWSTGEVTSGLDSIEIDTAGVYWVEALYAGGCTSYDEIEITEYGVTRQVYHQWYFGDQAGLDFNTNPPTPLTDGAIETPEGCATMSDQNGQLLFYTNGSTVWNREHNVMINGDSLGGDSTAAQSAEIVPFADDNTMFYIFTTEQVYGDFSFQMKMSIVDIKKDTARGEVVIKNIPIVECSSERITTSAYQGSPWVLTHEYGNSNFRSYQATALGLTNARHSSAGASHIFEDSLNATGYMKFAPGLEYLAVALPGDTINHVEIFDFNLANGSVSNGRLIDIEETEPIYGVEFSGNSQKLYVTTPSKLLQYDLDSIDAEDAAADIMATKYAIEDAGSGFGALQRTIYGPIYMAVNGQTQLGSISSPDANDDAAGFQLTGVDLGGRMSALGLPQFTQQITQSPQTPSISTDQACLGLPTSFGATGRDGSIEEYSWQFGDGRSSTEQNPVHTYDSLGIYYVELTLSNRCDTNLVLRDTVEIFAIPELPTVPEDTALCGDGVLLFAWPNDDPNLNYYWSGGDTTRFASFFRPEIVDVAIISDEGCSSDTVQVFIGEDETFIELGEPRTICERETLILDSGDPGPNFVWYRDNRIVGRNRTQRVSSGTPGTYLYKVEITNDFTGCVYTDSVQVTVRPGPDAFQTDIISPNCGLADGSFALQIDSSGNYSYALTGPVSYSSATFDGPGTTPPFTNLLAGSYTSRVTNTVTGCVTREILQLEDNAPFEMEAIPLNECARNSDIAVTFSDRVPANVEINVLDAAGQSVYTSTEQLFNKTVYLNDLDSGLYFVEVRDLNPPGCIQTDTVQLSVAIDCYRQIFVPNSFTPNADGLNDTWAAFPHDFVDQFEVFIFNRWGDVIFYSSNKNFAWDGTFAGADAPQGTYAYKMLFTTTLEPEVGIIEQKGSVTVLK